MTRDPRLTRRRLPVKGVLIAGAVAGAILLGGGIALADGNPTAPSGTPSTSSPTTSSPGSAGPATGAPVPGKGTPPARPGGRHAGHGKPGADRPAPAGNRTIGTVTSVTGSTVVVRDDTGTSHTLTLGQGAHVDQVAAGDRVQVTATGGTATDVHRVLAHVDGVVTDVNGTIDTVITPAGLHQRIDVSRLATAPAKGAQVHLQGTIAADGTTVVATAAASGPR